MEKTKLGITIKLYGAALYFIALFGIIPLVLAAGYALLVEENQWLKRVAVKAIAVVLFFGILSNLLGLLTDSNTFLNTLIFIFDGSHAATTLLTRLITLVRVVLSILQVVVLLVLGFRALNMRDAKVGPLDALISKNM